ncbi:hypothetical protein U1Q18_032656 [Sarracenia purpurea var. burkii]
MVFIDKTEEVREIDQWYEDSTSGGVDSVVDKTSGDVFPPEICTEVVGSVKSESEEGGTYDETESIGKVPAVMVPSPLLGDEVTYFASGNYVRNVDVLCQVIDESSVGPDPSVEHKDIQIGNTVGCLTRDHQVFDNLRERTPSQVESCSPNGTTMDKIKGSTGKLHKAAECDGMNETLQADFVDPTPVDFSLNRGLSCDAQVVLDKMPQSRDATPLSRT